MTAEATFGALVDRVIAGQAVTSAEFGPELRIASLLFASHPLPSPAFAASLERRLAVQPRRAVSPRFAWAGGLAALLLLAIFTVTPARAGVASVIGDMLRVFVGDEPDDAKAVDSTPIGRVSRPDSLAVVEDVVPGAVVPTRLPDGLELIGASRVDLRSGSAVQVQYGPNASNVIVRFVISLPSGFDFSSQGSPISGNGVVGTLDHLNDRVGTNVLSWTDGRYLYQIFAPLSPEELLEMAGSAK